MEHDLCFGCMEHTGANGSVCTSCGFDLAANIVEPHQLVPGTVLAGRYIVGRVLGEGGFGITYVGRDTLLDMKVAIKEFYMSGYVNRNNTYSTVVQASIGTHAEMFEKNRDKFLQEARVLAKFSTEDGIVGIRDFFQENNTAYIVMEFLNGGTMRDYLSRVGKLTWEQTHRILRPILSSLSNVHNHDIIHRDISPDNIMMTRDGKVKLLDFGAARTISKTDIKSLSVILKPGYAPEEQYRSKGQQGPWTDIYALCATMYRCLTGEVPDDSMERMYNDQVQSPYERGVCPIAISNVLMKGLAVRQADRYQSIPDFCAALAEAEKDPHNPAIAALAAPHVPRPIDANATVYAGGEQQPRFDNEPITNPGGAPVVDPDATVYAQAVPAQVRRTGPITAPPRAGATHPGTRPVSRPGTPQPRTGPVSGIPRTNIPPARPASADDLLIARAGGSSIPGTPTKVPGKEPTRAPVKTGSPQKKPVPSVPQKAVTPEVPVEQPRVKKANSKKLLLTLILIPVALLVLLGTIYLITNASSKPSGEIPYPFDKFAVTINDNAYELPMMLDELLNDGWIPENEADLQKSLKPGYTSASVYLNNGYGKITVSFKNPTDSTLSVADCPIYYLYISHYGLTYNYLNEVRNSAEIANGMELGVALESEFKKNAPKGYGVDRSYNNVYTYEDDISNSYYEVRFDDSDKTLDYVTIRTEIPDDFMENTYAVQPPEFDEAAFKQNAQLQWLVQAGDACYATSVYVNDLLSTGWELEKGPEYVASGSSAQVYLRYDTLTTATVSVKNYFDTSIIPEYCFVDNITVYSSDAGNSDTFTLCDADVSVVITKEMTLYDVITLLEANGIHYEQDGDKLTLYPNGESDSRHIIIQFLTSGGISSYTLAAREALQSFFSN